MHLKKQKTISKLSVSSVHQTGYWSQSNLTLTAHHLWLYFTFWLVWLMLPTQVALLFLWKYCKSPSEQLTGEGEAQRETPRRGAAAVPAVHRENSVHTNPVHLGSLGDLALLGAHLVADVDS